jgi:hypothetical protein
MRRIDPIYLVLAVLALIVVTVLVIGMVQSIVRGDIVGTFTLVVLTGVFGYIAYMLVDIVRISSRR